MSHGRRTTEERQVDALERIADALEEITVELRKKDDADHPVRVVQVDP